MFCIYLIDAPLDIPKYQSSESQKKADQSADNSTATEGQDQQIDKLRVNLFSGWGENSTKNEEFSINELSSEVEMLDSSNMKQE